MSFSLYKTEVKMYDLNLNQKHSNFRQKTEVLSEIFRQARSFSSFNFLLILCELNITHPNCNGITEARGLRPEQWLIAINIKSEAVWAIGDLCDTPWYTAASMAKLLFEGTSQYGDQVSIHVSALKSFVYSKGNNQQS